MKDNSYLHHIDGLRAIAVLGIVVFHLFPGLIVGGYFGVDAFFVISGFLITGQIYEQHKRGNFSLQDFYVRRIFRLFPALLFTLLLSFLAAWSLLPPNHLERFSVLIYSAFSQQFLLSQRRALDAQAISSRYFTPGH